MLIWPSPELDNLSAAQRKTCTGDKSSDSAIWLAGGTVFWLRFVVCGARLTVLDSLRKLGQNGVKDR